MAARNPDVEFLLKLARDKSIEGRKHLVAVVSDIFFSTATATTPRERALMTDILQKLIEDVAVPVRRALAERLSRQSGAPHDVLVALAEDEIQVAAPILLKSEALLEIELIEIIRHRSLEHQLAIAMRRGVTEPVADALVETGSQDVMKALLENESAQIAQATMAYLVDQSKTVDSFQEPILRRHDVSPELVRKMYYWVSAALRQYILERHEVEIDALDDSLETVASQSASAGTQEVPGSSAPRALAQHLAAANQITPQLLLQSLRQGEVALFEALFAEMSGLRLHLVKRLLFEPGGEGLAIVCRAMETDRPTFASIFLLSRRARPVDRATDPRELSRVLALYDQMSPAAAQTVLARWRRDPEFLYAIKRIQEAAGDPAPA